MWGRGWGSLIEGTQRREGERGAEGVFWGCGGAGVVLDGGW